MKTPPRNPEFKRFTEAAQQIIKVSKRGLQQRIDAKNRSLKMVFAAPLAFLPGRTRTGFADLKPCRLVLHKPVPSLTYDAASMSRSASFGGCSFVARLLNPKTCSSTQFPRWTAQPPPRFRAVLSSTDIRNSRFLAYARRNASIRQHGSRSRDRNRAAACLGPAWPSGGLVLFAVAQP